MVWKDTPEVEREEERGGYRLDPDILKKKSSGKTPKGIILGYIKRLKDSGAPLEYLKVLESMYKEVANLETSEKVVLKSWKGKSSLQIIEKPDYFVVITFQKEDQDSEPKEVKREITKLEVNRIIKTINDLNNGGKIPTRDIGEKAYKRNWDDIFSDRFLHTSLNLILRLLDHYGMTHYRGRYTTVLKSVKEIQEVLK